jgi:UDP-galactopyranose mutase
MSKSATILGAGMAGSTMAHLLTRAGWNCTVIEKNSHVGGGIWTFRYGGHPYTKGPRPYYGWSPKLFEWLSGHVPMRRFPLECYSYVESEDQFFSFPIHEDDLPKMSVHDRIREELAARPSNPVITNLEEFWIATAGRTLYDMFVNEYTKKMWFLDSCTQFKKYAWSMKSHAFKSGPRHVEVGYTGYPIDEEGYNPYFTMALEGSRVITGQKVATPDLQTRTVTLESGERIQSDILISTIPPDELMGNKFGELPFLGREFIPLVLPCEQVFPDDMHFAYYTSKEPYTRVVEYKKITGHKSPNTLLVMEKPTRDSEDKLYSFVMPELMERAQKYVDSLPGNVYSHGRLGTYKYTTIEQTLAQSFLLFRKITGVSVDGLDEEFYDDQSGKKIKPDDFNK